MQNKNELDKELKKKLRPFISLWKNLSPDFKQLIKNLLFLLRKQGIERVGEENALKKRREFISAVHDGWKEAQKIVAYEVTIRLDDIAVLKLQLKEFQKQKDSEGRKHNNKLISSKSFEIKILRRFIDSLVWTLYDNEHSSLRRLPLPKGNDNLSKENIVDSMIAADRINEESTSFAIISDLTTFVHAGDLVVFKIDEGVSLVEVKSGEKNIAFSHAAQFSVETNCPYFDQEFTKDFNAKDVEHYTRTKKQWERLTNITNTINQGEGYDYFHNKHVKIIDKNFMPDFYFNIIVKCWLDLKSGKEWSINTLNECIYVGGYKDTSMGFVGFNSWMDGTSFKGDIFNISDSMYINMSKPLFCLDLPYELIEDVINGDCISVLCFDCSKFMEFANKKYPKLFGLAPLPKENLDRKDFFMIGKKAIYSYENGNKIFLGGGMLLRMIFDLHKPESVIDWTYKSSDIHTKLNKQVREQKKELARDKKNKIKLEKRGRRLSRKK